jgi:hypothetical protein
MKIPPRNAECLAFAEAWGNLRSKVSIRAENIPAHPVTPELNAIKHDGNKALPESRRRLLTGKRIPETIESP